MIYIEEHGESLAIMQLTIEEINNPYSAISDYFSSATLAMHRESVETLLLCATTTQQWNLDQQPRMFVRVAADTEKLLETAYLLQRNKDTVFRTNGSLITLADLHGGSISPSLYFPPGANGYSWVYLPRYLKTDEFFNPYLAFHALFETETLASWRKRLSEFIEFALIKNSVFELGAEHDILKISSLLYRVIEAAHLIDVRENKKSLPRPAQSVEPNVEKVTVTNHSQP